MEEKAKLPALGYSSALEALGEKFHSKPELLKRFTPGAAFRAGEQIQVPAVSRTPPGKAAKVVVDKSDMSVTALDAQGRVLGRYPATMGSEHDPLPIGTWKIMGVQRNPTFFYNPDLFWDAKGEHSKAKIAAGPNNPVGVVWIDLSKEHYGIHGTPEPSTIGKTESPGGGASAWTTSPEPEAPLGTSASSVPGDSTDGQLTPKSLVAPADAPALPSVGDLDRLRARELLLPVQGYDLHQLRDNFAEKRGGRVHEAIDMGAARGTPVLAVDDGVVKKLFTSAAGGLTVYEFDGDARYAYYYAHLDRYAEGLHE